MFRIVLRSVFRDRHRFALPAFAVLIGVACVSGSLLYTGSLARDAERLQRASRPDVSVEVRATGERAAADEALRRRLAKLPGVAVARGTLRGWAFLVAPDGTLVGEPSADIGVDHLPGARGADPRYPMTVGRGPHGPDEVAVDRWAADLAGYRVGDRVRVVVGGEVRTARLTGVFTVDDPATAAGGTVTAFDAATARALFAPGPGRYESVTLTAAGGTSEAALAERVAAVVPRGLDVATRAELDAEAAQSPDRKKLGTILLLFAGIVLFVSVFLVGNTFSMLSALRAREHALLRAVGAGRGRVLAQVLLEAALVGAGAAVVGHVLGVGVAMLLGTLFGPAAGPANAVRPDVLAPLPLVTALCLGVGCTAVSAFLPARRAAATAPVAALRSGLPVAASASRRRSWAGGVCAVLGASALATAGEDLGVLCLATSALLAGLVLLTPLFAWGVTRVLRVPVRRLTGVRGTLALANARRDPQRTAATSGALTVCVALVGAVTVAVSSLSATAEQEAMTAVPGDLRITAVDFGEIGDGTAARVARLPHVAAAGSVREAGFGLPDGSHLWTAAVDPHAVNEGRLVGLRVRSGDLSGLSRGIAVTTDLAEERGWRVGDRVTGRRLSDPGTADGPPLDREIVAVYDGPEALGPALLPERAVTGGGRPAAGVNAVLVRAEPGRTDAAKAEIHRALRNPMLLVEDRADAARAARQGFGSLLSVLYALLSVTVVVAALGVANTMSMAVLERGREIGLLRAVGLRRADVRSMLRVEAVVVSVLGAGLGVLAGTAAGRAAAAGAGAVVGVPWVFLLAVFTGAGVIGVLAALGPGVRAARVPVTRAVGGEVG
ncbi:ABC transporter permease [Streptomyces griseoviridis]|nr:FtsX-like permease family protein [Streptomyces niveoruber]